MLYASIIGYNNKLGDGRNYLHKKLNVNIIHNRLFRKGYLYANKRGIFSKYICKEPQSYFLNTDFITARCPIKAKIEYIFILGHRSINNRNFYIPKEYIDKKYWKNLFVKTDSKYLYFILEKKHSFLK